MGSRWTFVLVVGLLLCLAACQTQQQPPPTVGEFAFTFEVDPVKETVGLLESNPPVVTHYLPGDTTILIPGRDLVLSEYHYAFRPGNKLVIDARFLNIREHAEFVQPFFFTLGTDTDNIGGATAPLVTDDQLGGDGVLTPGEETELLRFEVTHRNQPFQFLVEASAVVVGPPIAISPSAVTVSAGDAAVTFSVVTACVETPTWSLNEGAVGSIDANSGPVTNYTPPVSLAEAAVDVLTVRACSFSASAEITVRGPEPNDTPGTATPIILDYLSPELGITPNDVDFFTFTLSENRVIVADVDADEPGSPLDAVLGLFDEYGYLIDFSDDVDGLDPRLMVDLYPGRYYLAVSGWSDYEFNGIHDQEGFYHLNVSVFSGPRGRVEPDYLYIRVPEGGTVEAAFTLSNVGGSDLEYSIVDGQPGFVPVVGNFTDAALEAWSSRARALPGEKRELRSLSISPLVLETIITDPLGDATGLPDVVAVEAERTATDVTLRVVMAPGTFIPGDIAGWLDFDLDQVPWTGYMPACFEQTLGAEAQLSFFDIPYTGNAVLWVDSTGFYGEYPVVLDTPDSFLVTLPLADLGDDGNFDVAGVLGNQFDPTDCVPDSGNGTVGEPGSAQDPVGVEPTAGTLAPGESQEVRVTVDGSGLSAFSYLDWEALVTTNSVVTPELRVYLGVEVVEPPPPPDSFEPNDVPAEATPIVLDFFGPELSLSPGDVDWFSFTLSEAGTVTADICAEECGYYGIDTVMGLFDDALSEIAVNDDWTGLDSYLQVHLDAGSYYLAVSGCCDFGFTGGHGSGGGYLLEVYESMIPPDIIITPDVATVVAGDPPVAFSANLINCTETPTWDLNPGAVGSIDPVFGTTTSYTPPANLASTTVDTLSASACGVSANATVIVAAPGAGTMTVAGRVLQFNGDPAVGMAVQIDDPQATLGPVITDSNGNFVISGVTPPYTLSVVPPPATSLVPQSWDGVTRPDPVAVINPAGGAATFCSPPAPGTVNVTLSTPVGAGNEGQVWLIAEGINHFELLSNATSGPLAPGTTATTITVAFDTSLCQVSITGRLVYLERNAVSGNLVNQGTSDASVVTGNTVFQDMTVNTATSQSITGTVTFPAGTTSGFAFQVLKHEGASLLLPNVSGIGGNVGEAVNIADPNYDIATPQLNGIDFRTVATNSQTFTGPLQWAYSEVLAPGDTANLSLPGLGATIQPSGSIGNNTTPTFSFTPVSGTNLNQVYWEDTPFTGTRFWQGLTSTGNSIGIPSLPAPARLEAGTAAAPESYLWGNIQAINVRAGGDTDTMLDGRQVMKVYLTGFAFPVAAFNPDVVSAGSFNPVPTAFSIP